MKTHPTSEELLDLALGLRGPAGHVGTCEACGAAYAKLKAEQEALGRVFRRAEPGAGRLERGILERLDDVPPVRTRTGAGFAVAAAGIIFGVAFLGVIAVILFMPRAVDRQLAMDHLALLEREANALDAAGRFDEAIEVYREALDRIEGNDFFKTRAMEMRARIKQIEVDRDALAAANREFAELARDVTSARGADRHHDLLKRAKALRERVRDSDIIPWKGDLAVLIERIGKVLDTEAATNKRLDFQVRRNEITAVCKLSGDPNKALWGEAVAAWKAYQAEGIADVSRTKADNEIRVINNRARDSFRTFQRRIARLREANLRAEAIELFKKESGRFRGTDSEKELDVLLRDLDR